MSGGGTMGSGEGDGGGVAEAPELQLAPLSFRLLNDARRRLRLIGCRTSFSLSPIELNWDN